MSDDWIADPAGKTVTIHTDPEEGHYRSIWTSLDTARSVLLPQVTFDIDELFAPVSPHRR